MSSVTEVASHPLRLTAAVLCRPGHEGCGSRAATAVRRRGGAGRGGAITTDCAGSCSAAGPQMRLCRRRSRSQEGGEVAGGLGTEGSELATGDGTLAQSLWQRCQQTELASAVC